MNEDVIIVAIVFGSILGMIAIPMLINLAKKWIDRNNSSIPEEQFDRLAKAFMQYKKDTEQRLQNLEAIVTEQDQESTTNTQSSTKQIDAPRKNIEIEDQEPEKRKSQSGDSDNLRNMLRE